MINLFKNWYLRHFSAPGTVEFALVLLCSFLIVYYLMWLVGPLVVALAFAYILDWAVRALERKLKFNRTLSSSIVMIVFVGIVTGICLFVVPKIMQQANQLYSNLQTISSKTVASDNGQDFEANISNKIYEFAKTLPEPVPSMVTVDDISGMISKGRDNLLGTISKIVKDQVMPSVFNAMTWLMYLIIVPIFTFLMLANKHVLQKRVRTYVLPNNQALIHEFWPQINAQIEGYIRGKLIHITVISIVNTIAFLILGLDYAFLLGLGVGLSVLIPYVGAVIITIPIVLVALFQFGFGSMFVTIMVVYLIIQLLDGNVLTPMLFSKAMNLDAFSILAAIFIFGGLWGFWGVFFSIPLATFIRTIIINWPNTKLPTDPKDPDEIESEKVN